MINIKVLVENSSISKAYLQKHGLSLLINDRILLDVGPDRTFIKNAVTMNVDLSAVNHLVLSHSHIDHTGGLNDFDKINSKADIVSFDDPANEYYTKVLRYFTISVGLKINSSVSKRMKQIKDNMIQIDQNAWFIKNSINTYHKSSLNKALYKKIGGNLIPDTFDHEGILVINDNNNLSVFNSCSHNGVMNTIETVRTAFPNMNISNYFGGFHLCNPVNKANETVENLKRFTDEILGTNVSLYTGHCTGEFSYSYIRRFLGNRIHKISTGMELVV